MYNECISSGGDFVNTQQKSGLPFDIATNYDYNTYMAYHSHFQYEIYYFHGGKVNYLINDRIYVLEAGDLLLMHGMTLHRAHIDPSEPYHRTTLHMDPSYFKQIIQPSFAPDLLIPFQKLQNVRLQLRGAEKIEIEATLHKLEQLFKQHTTHSHQRFHAVLLDLMLMICELCKVPLEAIHSFPSSKEHHVQAVISYLEKNYSDDITLEGIQSELHLSKYYLSKTFKEVTGITIFQFLMQRRIYQAKVELIDSNQPITDIGYEVGFKHPSHFSRAFKLQTFLTPEQYRKQNQLKSNATN